MTVSRTDLERLTPEDVERYLSATGWLPAGDFHGRATVWELERRELEVLVPVSVRFRDYPQRVYEIVRTLAEVEARPESEVVRSLAIPRADRQTFRLFPDAPSGMIHAADAAEAFQGVRELLIAAAYAEQFPDAGFVLPSSKPKAVREFPEKALLSTAPGSFIISAEIPLSSGEGALFHDGDSFERKTVLRLHGVVSSAWKAAREAAELAELTPFTQHAGRGISRTLCQGLARLGGAAHERPFEIGFGWAGAVPADVPAGPIRFEGDQVSMLSQAAEDLGRRPPPQRAEMRGRVRTMDRHHPEDQGWVVVRGTLTVQGISRNRQVWVPLSPTDYDRALRAHGQGLEVRIAGTLTRTGRRAELRPDEYFRVL